MVFQSFLLLVIYHGVDNEFIILGANQMHDVLQPQSFDHPQYAQTCINKRENTMRKNHERVKQKSAKKVILS